MGRESEDSAKRGDKLSSALGWFWVICVMIPAGLLGWALLRAGGMPPNVQDWGILGDFVGGISNPFISALTFLALILTILQNQKVLQLNEAELKETRREIELTREANEQQAIEFRAQNEIARNQSEIQTTTEALLKITELINNLWHEPTEVFTSQPSIKGIQHNRLHLLAALDMYEAGKLGEEYEAKIDKQMAEVVHLVIIHKNLLQRLIEVSPNDSMVTAMSLLVKEPVKTSLHKHFLVKKAGDREAHELISFYEKCWN